MKTWDFPTFRSQQDVLRAYILLVTPRVLSAPALHYSSSLQDSSSWVLEVSVSWFGDQPCGQKFIGCILTHIWMLWSGEKGPFSKSHLLCSCSLLVDLLCVPGDKWGMDGWIGLSSLIHCLVPPSASYVCSGHMAGAATTPAQALAFTDPAVWGSPEHTCYPFLWKAGHWFLTSKLQIL